MSGPIPRAYQRWATVLGIAVIANLIILSPVPLLVKAITAIALTNFLPGALLVDWLLASCEAPPPFGERLLYMIGTGYANMVVMMLAISYLPGGVTRSLTLITFDLGLLVLLVLSHRPFVRMTPTNRTDDARSLSLAMFAQSLLFKQRWLLAGLLTLAIVGGFLRFTNLGYAEFQGDEARLTLRAAYVLQGYENVLFIHQKGPTEILLPTVVYALTDRLTETTARLPFTIANFSALFALFLLGWRLFGPVAGWSAAMLLALDGYIVGFARVVQYQSIVLLMVILVVLIFYRLAQQPKALGNYLIIAALLLATGLLAHYEAALVIFPVAYLMWRIWWQGTPLRQLALAVIVPLLLGALILASFYVPYVLNPSFSNTYAYLTGYRMGGGGTYNHLAEFFDRTTVYSSTYYLVMLIALAVLSLGQLYWRNLAGLWRWLALAVLGIGMVQIFRSPSWIKVDGVDYTWIFFASMLLLAWLMPTFPSEERLVWLWFGAPMILALFFTAIPNTHVYGFFIAWILVAGMMIGRGWQALSARLSLRAARMIAIPVALGVFLLFGLYEYWYFVYNDVEILRTWQVNRPKGYWVPYTMPTDVAIFGFPLNNGWKAVASLYEAGVLQGNYATNHRDTVADWYTRGAHNCARDVPPYYFLVNRVEPGLADETAQLRRQIQQDHELFGTVLVHGQPGLEIYKMGKTGNKAQQFRLEQYTAHFDQTLSGPQFEPNGPVGNPMIQHPLNTRFGDAIWLKGYTLDQTVATPGGTLALTLYWQATQQIDKNYFVFVQAIDLKDFRKAGQRDGQPGCNAYPTTGWLPGDVIADHYTMPLEPDAQPGEYTLLIGLTIGDQRLEVHMANGQPAGNQFELTKITLKP